MRKKPCIMEKNFLRIGLQIFCLKLVSVLSDVVVEVNKKTGAA
jgi:hypothetical protein